MKKLVRVMSTCSIVALGAIAIPQVASAAPAHVQHAGNVSGSASATEAAKGARGRMIERALDAVDLRPDQKDAIDKLKTDAEQRYAPVKAAKRELMLKVADQLEHGEGKVDRCALAPQVKAIASAVAKARPADRQAFQKLHDILDQDQRGAFVDALKREYQAMRKAHQPEVIVEKMGKELNLSAEQKDSLKRILTGLNEIREAQPSIQQHRAHWSRILDAFKSDDFDLDEIAPSGNVEQRVTNKLEARLGAANTILPVLNQQQRKLAADKLRDKAERMGREQHGSSPTMEPGEG